MATDKINIARDSVPDSPGLALRFAPPGKRVLKMGDFSSVTDKEGGEQRPACSILLV